MREQQIGHWRDEVEFLWDGYRYIYAQPVAVMVKSLVLAEPSHNAAIIVLQPAVSEQELST